MSNMVRNINGFVIVSMIFLMALTALNPTIASGQGMENIETVSVPQLKTGDSWGYKVQEYPFSDDYYGIGYEIVDEDMVNGHECYKVEIWWDEQYGPDEDSFDIELLMPGISYAFRYSGYAYITKDDLALAKFTYYLRMRLEFDGSKFNLDSFGSDLDGIDAGNYSEYMARMSKWKYDVDVSFETVYLYDPPFMTYDFPLEIGKKWSSTSNVTVEWEYSSMVNMNNAMKNDMEEMQDAEFMDLGYYNEVGSNSTQYSIQGSFEVIDEDIVETDTGNHSVFEIDYYITSDLDYGTSDEPIEDYETLSLPGEDATLNLLGIPEGDGTIYYDANAGYPQQLDTGGYFSEPYTTVEPKSIENTFNSLPEFSDKDEKADGKDKAGDDGSTLLYVAALVAGVIIIVFLVVVLFIGRMVKNRSVQYPPYSEYNAQPYDERVPAEPPIVYNSQQDPRLPPSPSPSPPSPYSPPPQSPPPQSPPPQSPPPQSPPPQSPPQSSPPQSPPPQSPPPQSPPPQSPPQTPLPTPPPQTPPDY